MNDVTDIDFVEVTTAAASTARRPAPHWLLVHPYGRELLLCKLRAERSQLRSKQDHCPQAIHADLEAMIDRLKLRDWPAPCGWQEQLRVAGLLLRMIWAMRTERQLPTWR